VRALRREHADANLVGIEYIISERQFEGLPEEEKKYWHPHNGEILSGQLVAPGLPAVAERELMRQKVNSYGKTWHLWHTRTGPSPATRCRRASPARWSFGREGEADPALVAERDRRMGVSTEEKRRERQELVPLASRRRTSTPQRQVRQADDADPGVVDKAAGPAAPRPAVGASVRPPSVRSGVRAPPAPALVRLRGRPSGSFCVSGRAGRGTARVRSAARRR
jgi:hypothetical protein